MKKNTLSILSAVATSLLLTACGSFQILEPASNTTVSSPVATTIKWTADLEPNSLHIVVDNNDVTGNFAINGQTATAHLPLPAGTHSIQVNGNLWNGYYRSYQSASNTQGYSVFNGNEGVVCSVFDDGESNLQAPSNAILISGSQQGKACNDSGVCRKWFGDCKTVTTAKPVFFYAFDDGSTHMTGPSSAVYIPSAGKQACLPDGTATGACRKWFGQAFTSDGRTVACKLFDDSHSNATTPSDAIYIPSPIPANGSACMPDQSSTGTCRRWFGECSTVSGDPITYTEVVTGTIGSGFPAGQLGSVSFGVNTANPNVILTFTFQGNTANVIPYYIPTSQHYHDIGINDGFGYMINVGTASIVVKDALTQNVLAQGTFLPEAGIFISIDNGNSGIGFGSHGAVPSDPTFPNHGVEVAYPYAAFLAPHTDLKSNYNYNTRTQNSLSVQGFSGSPGNGAYLLPTDHGELLIKPDSQADPTPTVTFTIVR